MTIKTIRFLSIPYIIPIILHRQIFPEGLAVPLFYAPSERRHQGTEVMAISYNQNQTL